jgi:hypothetical protein
VATIQYRASKLEIETKFGITASELRSIRDYPNRRIGRRYTRSTMQELQEEMEALK